MRNWQKWVKIALFALMSITLCYVLSIRTNERVASYRTPDETHKHQVFSKYPLTEEFTAQARGLSDIGVFADAPNPEEIVHIVIQKSDTHAVISEQDVQVQNLNHIYIPRQAMSLGNRYSITMSADQLSKSHSIKISYQSDGTLDPTSIVTQGAEKKQGALGLIEYEHPTIALQLARWLALPHQRGLWVGVIICVAGIFLQKKIKATQFVEKKKNAQIRIAPLLYTIVIVAAFIMYWPATHLFFYSDDVPILVRVQQLWQSKPLLLLTPHRYTDPDSMAQFGFDFYRPISFSLYPLILHLAFPLNASLYYFLNISLFAGTACCLLHIARKLLKSTPASMLTVFLWMAHSSKLGLLYWWSSVQDLLASFFAMLSVALFFKWKNSGNKKILHTSIAVFLIALFSKEYVIVLPIALAGIELLGGISKKNILATLKNILPYVIASGVFLIINTAVLGDPTLPAHKHTDRTYALSVNPVTIVRNIVVYTSFTAEQRIWPETNITNKLENTLSRQLELWRLKTAGPYYPGVIIIGLAMVSIVIFWKDKYTRNILLLGYTWWILFIGPFLLFTSDWRSRWLTLSIFGSSLAIVIILQKILLRKRIYAIYTVLAFLVFIYGYTTARDPVLTRFFREQSAYTQIAYTQLLHEEKNTSEEKRIILVGITPDQQTSLNAYLFRLYAKNPNADIIYAATTPERKEQGDVIINMTGIVPYYPESEK